ncbi:MAG: nicotinate-nucleotide adenylyltransferase [Planctomycetia bacterium]|nr:nicotinate-nucleotide adenylyltransferase [Planctomycetia bacterium]
MRLGLLGGSFDPVHFGHLLLAECCREQRRLDEVWFLPAAVPPHKQGRELTPAGERIEMLELAIGGHEAFTVSRLEIDRGGVSYTVDTLAELRRDDPARELFFLLGADSLADLPRWKDPQRICELAMPVVVNRAGAAEADFSVLASLVSAERLAEIRRHQVEMPQIGLSASDIRRRVAAGQSIRYRTPRAVEKYIETHKLYRGEEPAPLPLAKGGYC